MHISPLAQRLLKLVFAESSAQGPLSRPRLERRSGHSRVDVTRGLEELARLGLVDARRLRLTLAGLACAVACGARAKAKPRAELDQAPRSSAVATPIALFFQREPPRAVA
jgi:hypothetical protein